MDGIHDVGGMEGFGPVRATSKNDDFRDNEEWEKRMWALSRQVELKGTDIDWFRHVVELMLPKDYLSFPYFNKWCSTIMVLMADNGATRIADFQVPKGPATTPVSPPPSKDAVQAVLDVNRNSAFSFQVPSETPATFAVGDKVQTLRHMPSGHTRLPRYARDVVGEVIAHHGCHPLPDQAAQGNEHAEHLYTVRFAAQSLWGPDAHPRDTVTLDLWDSYIVHA